MKRILSSLVVFLAVSAFALGAEVGKVTPAEAAKAVADGTAVLVDVRESEEWAETGVAEPALLLSKSDFENNGEGWKVMLEKNADKRIILYCRSGNRAGQVAEALAKQGKSVANAGGFEDWKKAGLPVRKVKAAE